MPSKQNTNFYECYLNGKPGDQKCIGKVIPNEKKPGLPTNLTSDLVLVFNIYDILEFSEDDDCSTPSPGPGPGQPVMCDPNADPPQKCPGNKNCPQCGQTACACPPK